MRSAADRAERHALDVLILRQVLPHREGLGDCGLMHVPDRKRAHGLGRGEVALEERRRHAERIRDVIEAVGRVVRRQERRDIDIERQQIANGVGVLRAVEPMQERTSGMRVRVGLAVERRFQERRQRVQRCAVGLTSALGWHRSRVQPPEHLLPQRRIAAHASRHRRCRAPPRTASPRFSRARCDRRRSTDREADAPRPSARRLAQAAAPPGPRPARSRRQASEPLRRAPAQPKQYQNLAVTEVSASMRGRRPAATASARR